MRRLLPLLLLALSARAATVQTLDGLTLQGRIQLERGGTLLLWPSNNLPIPIALTNLVRADFSNASNLPPTVGPQLRPLTMDEERGALPEPWKAADIGRLEQPGNAVHSHGRFAIEVTGGAPAGNDEGFHFVYQSFRGNGEIIARVASVSPRDENPRQPAAGITIRSSIANDANSVRITLTGNGSVSFRRHSTATASAVRSPVNSLATLRRPDRKPPYWLKLVREDKLVSAYQSADGQRWELVQQAEVALPDRFLIGVLAIGRRRGAPGTAEFDHVTVRPLEPRAAYTPRLVLKDGTVIADHFRLADETQVHPSKDKQGLRLLTRNVARIEFRPLEDPDSLPVGRAGVWLSNGDFVDGDFQSVTNGRIRLSSVLFGQRSFPLDRKVAAVILADAVPQPAAFAVKTLDGSIWRARSITLDENGLEAETTLVGRWKIAAAELKEIARMSGQ